MLKIFCAIKRKEEEFFRYLGKIDKPKKIEQFCLDIVGNKIRLDIFQSPRRRVFINKSSLEIFHDSELEINSPNQELLVLYEISKKVEDEKIINQCLGEVVHYDNSSFLMYGFLYSEYSITSIKGVNGKTVMRILLPEESEKGIASSVLVEKELLIRFEKEYDSKKGGKMIELLFVM